MSISIKSSKQSGGITAQNVNIQPQKRYLTVELKLQINEIILKNTGKNITVVATLGNQEALEFASEIFEYIKSKGREVSGVYQAVYTTPIKWQHIKEKKDSIEFVIGSLE